MRKYIERLMRCGIPEEPAEKVINFLYKHRRTMEIIAYVRMTEEATG